MMILKLNDIRYDFTFKNELSVSKFILHLGYDDVVTHEDIRYVFLYI
jgi:hypothetical protein